MSSSEEESGSEVEEVEEPPKRSAPAPKKQIDIPAGLDEASLELLDANRKDRERMEEEINELRARAEKRKKQREIEEKRHAKERADEEERRKAVEEEKKKKREEDELNRQHERAAKQAEFEKFKNPGGPNFVIKKKEGEGDHEAHRDPNRKSKEQLDAEKKAILSQRVVSLEISGFDSSKLTEKAKELHKIIYKLENEKYDLEKQFKVQQADLMELAEKARKANKVGKGGLKRVQPGDEVDMIQAKFTGTPAKIEMFSKYERQKDKREYSERKTHFSGPQYIPPAERIKASKQVEWDEERMPIYQGGGGGSAEAAPAEVAAAE